MAMPRPAAAISDETKNHKNTQPSDIEGKGSGSQVFAGHTFSSTSARISQRRCFRESLEGRLAQRLERPVYTRKVACSNHALPTKNKDI